MEESSSQHYAGVILPDGLVHQTWMTNLEAG
jgi:hypothetical protein